MKLLLITYSYTPDLTPRAFRWSAIVKELVARGHEVHVLCASPLSECAEVPGPVVHRVKDWLLNGFKRVTPGIVPNKTYASATFGIKFRNLLRKFVRLVWRALYWPDYACGWVIPALCKASDLHSRECFDWIISTSHPFSGHLVGLLLKKKFPSARWLVDISDPYALMNEPSPFNRNIYESLSKWVEGCVVKYSNVISVTTESTKKLYCDNFRMDSSKVIVIPTLLSLPTAPSPIFNSDDTLKMVFVGTLYRQLRSPIFLLLCAASLKQAYPNMRIELHFYGALNDCAELVADYTDVASPFVFYHGMVDRMKVMQAMVDAHVLVNIGNDSESQLASKVVEYMAVGKPIINIISKEKDTSAVVLSDYPAVLTLMRSDEKPDAAIIERLYNFLTDLPMVDQEISIFIKNSYSPTKITEQYEQLLVLS